VIGAILMVSCHAAPRVLVAGISHGELILDRCKRVALEVGVRVTTRPTAREDRPDLVVEAIC